MTTTDDGTWTEATDVEIDRVDLVAGAANGTAFLIQKAREDKAKSGVLNAEEVAELIKDDGESAITSDLDVTTPLADDAENGDGVTSMPGSPAWEAVDAATARKWAAILARAKNAVQLLSERERTEAATDPDGDDYGNAWDLDDAACAIDCAISLLAPYALGEEMEVEFGSDSPIAEVAKSLATNAAALETIESMVPLRKAGRVLSAKNESSIRQAESLLHGVLDTLPAPVDAELIEKAADTPEETTVAQTPAVQVEVTLADALTKMIDDAPRLTPFEALLAIQAGGRTLAKAKGDAQLAVFDENGKLIGTVDPADLSPIASNASQAADAGADVADAPAAGDAAAPAADAAATPAAPAPKAEAPAAPAAAVVPGTATVQAPVHQDDQNVAKAASITEVLGDVFAPFAEQLKAVPELAKAVEQVQERLEKMAQKPDDRNSPKLFGAAGAPGPAARGGESGDEFAALQKAVDDATDPGAKRDAIQQLGYAMTKARFAR